MKARVAAALAMLATLVPAVPTVAAATPRATVVSVAPQRAPSPERTNPERTSPARTSPARTASTPPPVDRELLPSDWRPSPAPGVRQNGGCSLVHDRLDTAAAAAPFLWGVRQFRLPELWRSSGSTGAGITLAIIDTGVARHELFGTRLVGGGDYVSTGTGTQDCDGHGTTVAGIAAAGMDVRTGFSGVAPGATVLAIRQTSQAFTVAGPSGDREAAGDTRTLARAVVAAVRQGATVINLSVVSCEATAPGPTSLQAALRYAVEHDVVVVASAGNTGEGGCPRSPDDGTVVLPGWYDSDVLTVGAIGASGVGAIFSYPGPWVDVAAPGQDLMSVGLGGSDVTRWAHDLRGDGVDQPTPIQGTSFAAPAVAGLAVLVRAKYPDLTATQVVERILATARGTGARGRTLGYGTVDPLRALEATSSGPRPDVLAAPALTAPRQNIGRLDHATSPSPDHAGLDALWGTAIGLFGLLLALPVAVGRCRAATEAPDRRPAARRPRRT
jgi:membrane-anchored mycosin MYCP